MNKIDPAKNIRLSKAVRDFLKVLNSSGGPAMETLSPGAARQVLVDAQLSAKVSQPECKIEQRRIQQNGLEVLLYIVRPMTSSGNSPAFLFVHRGGWVLGDFPTHERLVRDLVAKSGFTAVFVEYSRSPEAKYPVALDEIYAGLQWLAAQGAEIGVDTKQLAIVGNSVGGNMAAATALRALHQNGPMVKAQVLLWPVTDATFDTQSYEEFANGYFLTRAMMKWFWDAYTANAAQRSEIYASPLQADLKQLNGLPPTLVQVAGADVLRDEGIAFARKLDDAGVPVTLVQYDQLIHDYGLLNALSNVPSVVSALNQAAQFLRAHLV